MRTAVHALLLTLSLMLVSVGVLPAVAADDEYIALLFESRRLVVEGIAETQAELGALEAKANDDDLLVFPTSSGVIEVDLRRADEVVPLVQVALSDPEIKAAVLRGIQQADPDLWGWAKVIEEGQAFAPRLRAREHPRLARHRCHPLELRPDEGVPHRGLSRARTRAAGRAAHARDYRQRGRGPTRRADRSR